MFRLIVSGFSLLCRLCPGPREARLDRVGFQIPKCSSQMLVNQILDTKIPRKRSDLLWVSTWNSWAPSMRHVWSVGYVESELQEHSPRFQRVFHRLDGWTVGLDRLRGFEMIFGLNVKWCFLDDSMFFVVICSWNLGTYQWNKNRLLDMCLEESMWR